MANRCNEYQKEKIAITIDKALKKRIDQIKSYPRWRGNRSEVIEEGVREFLNKRIEQDTKCIFCSCTDNFIFHHKCYWVIKDIHNGKGVCSQCALKVMQNPEKLKKIAGVEPDGQKSES